MDQKNTARDYTIRLEWNENGCPVNEAPSSAGIHVSVETGEMTEDGLETIRGVFIEGNAKGLRWLAAEILAIAETDLDGYHAHLDADAHRPVYRSAGGWELTISKRRERGSR